MTYKTLIPKIQHRLWNNFVHKLQSSSLYPFIYKSFWHYLLHKNVNEENKSCYYSARPNAGAGIGHQMANWIAGYWWAKQFGLKYVHLPFSTKKWENFLGFGEDEVNISGLVKLGYKFRRLPLFKDKNVKEIELNKSIIRSYAGKKVVFIAEQDQGYDDQYGVMEDLKMKFNNAAARKFDQLVYDQACFNIAVHVRRTVIIEGKVIEENEAVRSRRWLSNDYYEKVLQQVLTNIQIAKPVCIYIFSTGKFEEFFEFEKYGNVHICSEMDEYTSFLHLIRADLLITSKSSFSYKPALMNNYVKICPRNFWHSYPQDPSWILAENDGTFDINKLKVISCRA